MISKSDVIRMRVPFPNISSGLAVKAHMYICIEGGLKKKFIKCQTFKPSHALSGRPPKYYIQEPADPSRNPFQNTTTIDCDKEFCVNDVEISLDLLTDVRRDVSEKLFQEIINTTQHEEYKSENMDPNQLANLNSKIVCEVT